MKSKIKNDTRSFKKMLLSAALTATGMLLVPTTLLHATPTAENEPLSYPFKWQNCLAAAAKDNGKSEAEIRKLVEVIGHGAIKGDGDLLSLVVAIIAVESQFNPAALSSAGAIGLMQVTEVGFIEAERQCPYIKKLGNTIGRTYPTKLLDPVNNVRYGTCLLSHYLEQVQDNKFLGLVMYNGGYKQLTRLENNATLATETREYVLRVHQQLRRCQQ